MNLPAAYPHWIHSLKCELAEEVLRTSGTLRLQVNGWSMLPVIWPGDTLLIQAADLHSTTMGDIVLFGRCGRMVVHRVVETAQDYILTRGDSMPQTDPPVSNRDLLGKVQFILRDGRRIEPRRSPRLFEQIVAGIVQRSDIAARAIMGLCRRLQTSAASISQNRIFPCQS